MTVDDAAPFILRPPGVMSRRRRVATAGVVAVLFGSLASLPLVAVGMGLFTTEVHTAYLPTVPAENVGAYLVTSDGVLQLYSWTLPPDSFPTDAPTLSASAIRQVAVVQKQHAGAADYQLINLSSGNVVGWTGSTLAGLQLTLSPPALGAAEYALIVPTDDMFGGETVHFFRVSSQEAQP